jgi:hypothetical protein
VEVPAGGADQDRRDASCLHQRGIGPGVQAGDDGLAAQHLCHGSDQHLLQALVPLGQERIAVQLYCHFAAEARLVLSDLSEDGLDLGDAVAEMLAGLGADLDPQRRCLACGVRSAAGTVAVTGSGFYTRISLCAGGVWPMASCVYRPWAGARLLVVAG